MDAAVANISTVVGRSLQEQIDHVYKLPMTSFGIGLFVTTDKWASMGEAEKAAFEGAAMWFDEHGAEHSNNSIYPDEYWPMMEEEGIEVIEPSEDDIAKLNQSAEDVRQAWIEEVGKDVGERAIALALGEAS